MSAWRHEAFEKLPEFRSILQDAENSYRYWIELRLYFEDACRNENVELATRILNYADWSMDQPRGETAEDDLLTCVYCCFLEHVQPILEQRKTKETCLQAIKQSKNFIVEDFASYRS